MSMHSNRISFPIKILTLLFAVNVFPQMDDPIPQHDNFSFESKKLQETRVINVWLPPEYSETTANYPVLYMPDGGIKEDFPHMANTVAELVESKKIPGFILVGIENTDRRRDLTGFSEVEADAQFCPLTDGAKNFRAFISDELIPEINKRYRTFDRKGIIGESLAGLFVVETMFLKPKIFDFYIAMDPSLWWNDHYLTKNAVSYLQQFPESPIKLWFAGSSAEDIHIHTRQLDETLKTSAPKNVSWLYSDEPMEQHNSIFRGTKEKALIWTLN